MGFMTKLYRNTGKFTVLLLDHKIVLNYWILYKNTNLIKKKIKIGYFIHFTLLFCAQWIIIIINKNYNKKVKIVVNVITAFTIEMLGWFSIFCQTQLHWLFFHWRIKHHKCRNRKFENYWQTKMHTIRRYQVFVCNWYFKEEIC